MRASRGATSATRRATASTLARSRLAALGRAFVLVLMADSPEVVASLRSHAADWVDVAADLDQFTVDDLDGAHPPG